MSKRLVLRRRHMLKGIAGTAIGLPLLECMLDGRQARAAGDCRRYFFSMGGVSLVTDVAGPNQQAFVPDTIGANYDVKDAVQPIAALGLNDEVSIVSGLEIPWGVSGPQAPAGGLIPGDAFHFHSNPMLAGNRMLESGTTMEPSQMTGPTSDQIVANAFGDATPIASLCYRVQASHYYDSWINNKWTGTVSAEDIGGQIFAVTPQVSPQAAWEKLVGFFQPADPGDAAQAAFSVHKRKSVLDFVDRSIAGVLPRLGSFDKQRMERHYDEIRELENLLDALGNTPGGTCEGIDDPGADPPVGGNTIGENFDINIGYSDENARAEVFERLIAMAFACDLTRVCGMMYTSFQSAMNAFPIIGVPDLVHGVNHAGQQPDLNLALAWHVNLFCKLVDRLRNMPEGNGTVLDNCALAFLPEGGYSSSLAENSHTTENMAMLVAGGAGGLKRGHHIPANGAHPVQATISLMNAVGVPTTSLGEVNGDIADMFA